MEKKFNKYLIFYLSTLFFFSIIFLIKKHNVGNDSTISEWLINYSGGFTKRGLIGQLSIFLSNFFSINLRDAILLFQITLLGVYFALIFFLIKDIKVNNILVLAFFSPIFLLYPVAEIEVLARKEVFIFCIFIIYLFMNNLFLKNIYKILLLPIAVIIWEPVIFYFSFFLAVDIFDKNFKILNRKFFLNALSYAPGILIAFYIALNPISPENHQVMSDHLKDNFNENCYMSCALLSSKATIYEQFQGNFGKYSFSVFFRYFLILLFGFGPLIIILKNSFLINKDLFYFKYFKNLFLPFLILLTPVILLFAMGYDWGRWVNISYVFSLLFYTYLIKKNKISLNELFLKNKFIKILDNKKIFILVIIIFCFGWNPKTVITGDVASKPGYEIPKKVIRIIYNDYYKKN